jgi:outer membrane protein assembly factor BamD (BamD/ComL family)
MRKLLVVVWLLLPILAGAYHFGPGQQQVHLDEVDKLVAEAEHFIDEMAWQAAQEKYEAALELLPDERVATQRRLRLEIAKLQMLNKQLPEAHDALVAMKDELLGDDEVDQKLMNEVQAAYANSKYYMTWLMRLEGHLEEVWKPEIETSRQVYRQLAEAARAEGDEEAAKRYTEDLEASIKLARMNLEELQGLPLPSQ